MKLDFIIGGVQKSGTTSLHHHLAKHPEIHLPDGREQEINFFDQDNHYTQGLDWLKIKVGTPAEGSLVVGQTSPFYFYAPYVAERIYETFPDVKLIFILRDPVNRAYSGYWHERKKGRERHSFEKALELEETRISKDYRSLRQCSYFTRGLYGDQLERYLKYFKAENIHVLFFEELYRGGKPDLESTMKFLGVSQQIDLGEHSPRNVTLRPRSVWVQNLLVNKFTRKGGPLGALRSFNHHVNKVAGYPAMREETRQKLRSDYHSDIDKLSQLLGRPAPWPIK